MVNFDLNQMCTSRNNYYYFVVGIAKRARNIYAGLEGQIGNDNVKPVSMAIQEFIEHKYIIIE